MRRAVLALLWILTLCLVVPSFLPLLETNAWWVRMTDFPRAEYLILLAGLGILVAGARPLGGKMRLALGTLVLLAAGFNIVKLSPYLPHLDAAEGECPADRKFSVMLANVKLGNRQSDALLDIVRTRSPDLLLAMETDEWWDRELSTLSDEMPYTVSRITGGFFGIHLYSRLPLEETQVVFPVGQDAPAILASVTLPSGQSARFVGLHPRPPHPGQSSIGRDAQLMWAALQAEGSKAPALVAGDLNAVPWETVIERMQRLGALLDPRQVFGFLPTYHTGAWWMFWPLDQVLHQKGLSVMSVDVLPFFGSDHYPIAVALCQRASGLSPPEMRPQDLREAEQTIALARRNADKRP